MLLFGNRRSFDVEVASKATQLCEEVISEMGAELHDDLIQKVSILKLCIDRLERSANDPVEVLKTTAKMRSDFDTIISSIRATSQRMLPTLPEANSLVTNVRLLCQNVENFNNAHIHPEFYGCEFELEANTNLYLFRIIQELVHNALKHSSAWHIWVRLHFEPQRLTIEVEDDGTGSTGTNLLERLDKRRNTLNMRARALGAELSFHRGCKGLLARVVYTE